MDTAAVSWKGRILFAEKAQKRRVADGRWRIKAMGRSAVPMRLLEVAMVLSLATVLVAAAAGCGGSSQTSEESDGFLTSLAEAVDTGRMVQDIEYLASEELRGRPSGSPESSELEAFLARRLEELGLKPVGALGLDGYRQEFPVPTERCFLEKPPRSPTVTCANILGEIPGEGGETVVVTANYDGLGVDAVTGELYPGADYNASGAAAVLELARVISSLRERPRSTVVFALLGAEECGGYGSSALAEALEAEGFKSRVHIINLEGLGAGDGDYMDVWDLNYRKNRPAVKALDEAASLLGVTLEIGGADPGTSAATFFLHHLPAVTCDWSWFQRNEHPDFHLPSDSVERLKRDGLAAVARVTAVAIWLLAG